MVDFAVPMMVRLRLFFVALTCVSVTVSSSGVSTLTAVGRSADSELVTWSVGFRLDNAAVIEAELEARSRPGSPHFRQHMSQGAVRQLLDPGIRVRAAAAKTLSRGNATCVDLVVGLRCTARVAAINALYGTELHEYVHVAGNGSPRQRLHRAPPGSSFKLPDDGGHHFVSGLTDFPKRRGGNILQRLVTGTDATGARQLQTDYYVTPGKRNVCPVTVTVSTPCHTSVARRHPCRRVAEAYLQPHGHR